MDYRPVNYPDSVQFLYALGNEIKTAKLGLDRIRIVLDALGRPQDRLRFVHVAGTNGKGSTCAMIESGLRAAGRRTGLFTSPHLVRAHRAHPHRRPAGLRRAIRRRLRPRPRRRRTAAGRRRDRPARHLFRDRHRDGAADFRRGTVDMVVLEVGLGRTAGRHQRRDARALRHHPDRFRPRGVSRESLESIAGEKAGILKPGCRRSLPASAPRPPRCSTSAPRNSAFRGAH